MKAAVRRGALCLALAALGCGAAREPGLLARVAPCPRAMAMKEETEPQVSVRSRCMYYEVQGHSAEALRRRMNEAGPADETGTYDAYTSFALRYGFEDLPDRAGCRAGPVAVELNLAHILPEWRPSAEDPPELAARWRRFTEALAVHESGHADISVRAANDLARELSALPTTATCEELRGEAHRVFERAVGRLRQRHLHYDWRTGHGKRQGGRFP